MFLCLQAADHKPSAMYVFKYKQQQALLQKQDPLLNNRRSTTELGSKDLKKSKTKPKNASPKNKDEVGKLKRRVQMAKKRNKFLSKRISHYFSHMNKEKEISKTLKSQLKKTDLSLSGESSNVQENQSIFTETNGPTPTKRRRISGDLDENVSTIPHTDDDLKKLLEDERALSKLLQDQLDKKKMETYELTKEIDQLRIELEESAEKNIQLMSNFSKELASKELSSKESSPNEQNVNSSEIEVDSRIAELQRKNEELSIKKKSLEEELEREWCGSTKRISNLEYRNKNLNDKVDSMKATIQTQKERLEQYSGTPPVNSEAQNNEYLEKLREMQKKINEWAQSCSHQLAEYNAQSEALEEKLSNRGGRRSRISQSNVASTDPIQTPPPNGYRQNDRRSFVPNTSNNLDMNTSGASHSGSWHRGYVPPNQNTSTPLNPPRQYMFFNTRR
ncbi:hypothetical protein M3Y97_00755400 [Aphelenchoides bicaudatus]|nr:hypothetical protein M3Y97_00755400 [Aphelenchoides bicaudatus]